jgi:hypothetical protein
LLPGAPYVPEAFVLVLFVLVFPVFGAALAREVLRVPRQRSARTGKARRGSVGVSSSEVFANVPRPLRRAGSALAFVMWLTVMLTIFTGPAGQPTARDGRYFLSNHGEETEIDRDEYDRAVASWSRGFAAGSTVFYTVAAGLSRYGGTAGRGADGVPGDAAASEST